MIRMGREGETMLEYRLPYRNILPIPIFVPRDATQPDVTREPSPSKIQSAMDTDATLNGVCLQKREISSITEHKPMVIQPRSPDFRASSLISPPRDTLRLQRREWWADESCLPSWTWIRWQVWWVTSITLERQSLQKPHAHYSCLLEKPSKKKDTEVTKSIWNVWILSLRNDLL